MHVLPFFYDYVFPNVILPNALPPEMGVVNYMHTLYSNRLDTESFFDQDLELELNPMQRMFGNAFGDWPNSVRNGGSFLRSPCFHSLVRIKENSVYFGKRSNFIGRYVYPIKVTPHFARFTGVDKIGSKLNGEFFWKHISAEVLDDVRSGCALIFLDWGQENFIERQEYIDFHNGLKNSGIPKSQIILAINSFNAKAVYEEWFPEDERCIEVHNFPFLISHMSYHYTEHADWRLTEESFRQSRNTIRQDYFIYPIRRARDHRIALLHKLASDGILEKGDWSCLDKVGIEHGLHMSSTHQFTDLDQERLTQLHDQIPRPLREEPDSNYLNVAGWADRHSRQSENSYFYIASETYVHGVYKSLTEKIFKPLINFQPFIFLAFPGALNELRRLGFKTFSPFINEDYDNEQDLYTRMKMISDEISRLCSMSKEDIHNWYWSMEEILIHNHRHLLTIHKNEPNTAALVKYLYDRLTAPHK